MYIYLHVPFCKSRCIYCDFYVVLQKHGGQAAYVEAVLQEIKGRFSRIAERQRATDAQPPIIETLYVGGGTPSLLTARDYRRIIDALRDVAAFSPTAELTLEANPGHGNQSAMADDPAAYREAGFNRISVGVQSLDNAELKKLSRTHTAEEAENFIRLLQQAGWRNISIDLMYGLPLQTMASWQATLKRATMLGITHVSMYGLKVEDNTPLARLSSIPGNASGYAVPDDDLSVDMYFEGLDTLGKAGYRQYEISNLAKPGYESRHNLNYWEQGEWLALGPSAHGHQNGEFIENVRDLAKYLDDPMAEDSRRASTSQEQLENAIIFGLRKSGGLHIPSLEKRFDINFRQRYERLLRQYEADFLEWFEDGCLRLKKGAIPISHTLLAEFIDL